MKQFSQQQPVQVILSKITKKREIPGPVPCPGMGLILLGFSIFSQNQNNCSSSGAYDTCIYCGLSMKINMVKCCTAHKIMDTFVFVCVVGKNRKTPNFGSMADNSITRGSI